MGIGGYEEELNMALERDALESGEHVKVYISREMEAARKNTTQKYFRLLRLLLRLEQVVVSDHESFYRLKTILS